VALETDPTARVIPGAFDTSYNGSVDAFVTKLNPAGTAPLLYSSFLGGAGGDFGFGIALDAAGAAYVTGETGSLTPTPPRVTSTSAVPAVPGCRLTACQRSSVCPRQTDMRSY